MGDFLGERYALSRRKSVCRLFVTFVYPNHRAELFGNILHRPIS